VTAQIDYWSIAIVVTVMAGLCYAVFGGDE